MPDLFVELFSEEMPARLQARGAEDLARLMTEALAALAPVEVRRFSGPRRLAVAATVQAAVPATQTRERGPRVAAPEQALAGFLRKHGAPREALVREGDFWVLEKAVPGMDATALIADALPKLLRRFSWPKSMRWGGTSAFAWIRPLRRIVCLLDGAVVPFTLADGDDDGHGLASGCETAGHRVHGPGVFAVSSLQDWQAKLLANRVMVDGRAGAIRDGLDRVAAAQGVAVVEDAGLLEEVAGLVEWPVPLLGRIDGAYMDLPPEVMQVSMRVNQRYFATRAADGTPAPWFAFAANLEAPDGGAAIIAGNERVLRARFADARHFWDLDRRTRLADRVSALDGVTFHARLGSQGDRVRRLVRLAGVIAPLVSADVTLAERAALLCKADLTTGMVGEFPELQGVMGGYYAAHDGESAPVAAAVRAHYAPKGAGDEVPRDAVAIAVALADKLDQLAGFFSVGEQPTGSGDPYALRRAALGIIRIARDNGLRFDLDAATARAAAAFTDAAPDLPAQLTAFLLERLRVQYKAEGGRPDMLAAAIGWRSHSGAAWPTDIVRLIHFADALAGILDNENGRILVASYKRATNIWSIEEKRDGLHRSPVDVGRLHTPSEQALHRALLETHPVASLFSHEKFEEAARMLAGLRAPLDAFFEATTVNDLDPELRANRLNLLYTVKQTIERLADFSLIES